MCSPIALSTDTSPSAVVKLANGRILVGEVVRDELRGRLVELLRRIGEPVGIEADGLVASVGEDVYAIGSPLRAGARQRAAC